MNCPLCRGTSLELIGSLSNRTGWTYYLCKSCDLHFRDIKTWPESSHEQQRYRLHKNKASDEGYRKFLEPLIPGLLKILPPPADLLDYGCGPSPVLGEMLKESGYNVSLYDPLFFSDKTLLKRKVDIITATEVFEHFHKPADELSRLVELLRPGGILAVKTQPLPEKDFLKWHYLSDLTHVVFYKESCFRWIASNWDLTLIHSQGDLFYLQK